MTAQRPTLPEDPDDLKDWIKLERVALGLIDHRYRVGSAFRAVPHTREGTCMAPMDWQQGVPCPTGREGTV